MNGMTFGDPEDYSTQPNVATSPGQMSFGTPEGYDPKTTAGPPTAAQTAMATGIGLTPRRMGQYLEQRMLPALEEEQQKAEINRQQQLAAAIKATEDVPEWQKKAMAAAGSAAETATLGYSPYAVGAYRRLFGTPEEQSKSVFDLKKEAEERQQAYNIQYPGYSLTGMGAGLLGLGRFGPTFGASRGPVGAGAATGAVYGGLAGFAPEASLVDAIKGTAMGVLGGVVAAPIADVVAGGLTRQFATGRKLLDSAGNLTPNAVNIAKQAGLTDDQISVLGPQLAKTFEQRGLRPASATETAAAEFGIPLKKGMATGKERDLQREISFGDYGQQAAAAAKAGERFVGGPQAGIREAIESAAEAGKREAAGLKSLYERRYAQAGAMRGEFRPSAIQDVGTKIFDDLAQTPKMDFVRQSEVAQKVAQDLNEQLGRAFSPLGEKANVNLQFSAAENARKSIMKAYESPMSKTDRAAIREMTNRFDDYIERQINNGAFSGDPRIVDRWKEARSAFKEYQKRFGISRSGEDRGRLLNDIIENNRKPEEIANMMFSFTNVADPKAKAGALGAFNQLSRALGPNHPQIESVKKSYIQTLMTPKPMRADAPFTPQSFQKVANDIDSVLKGSNAPFGSAVLSPAEKKVLERYSQVMRTVGRMPDQMVQREISKLAKLAGEIGSRAGWMGAMMLQLPILGPVGSTVLGAVGMATGAGARQIQGAIESARMMGVNRPLRPETRGLGSVPAGVGATAQFPEAEQAIEDLRRPQRASGGRISPEFMADRIIGQIEKARKELQAETTNLLRHDDETIVKALKVANERI